MLPAARQAKVTARAQALIAEEISLRDLREARRQTQAKIAKDLNIGQDSVSRLERRSDMLISTLRDYVAALGGRMRVIVEFEDRPTIELKSLGGLDMTPHRGEVRRQPRRKPATAA